MLASPPEIFGIAEQLKKQRQAFVLATVIKVRGSSSARVGAKALVRDDGRIELGYLGGGCVEGAVTEAALAALTEKQANIITIDLDDEIFGLMPCGGTMDIYIEPHFPPSTITLPFLSADFATTSEALARQLGYLVQFAGQPQNVPSSRAQLLCLLADAIAREAGRSGLSLADKKQFPSPTQIGGNWPPLVIVSHVRMREAFLFFTRFLDWTPQFFGFSEPTENEEEALGGCMLPLNLKHWQLPQKAYVIIASHHRQDADLAVKALLSDASYVALVSSRKRAGLIAEELSAQGLTQELLARLHAPAGLNIPADTPSLIALSILTEILKIRGPVADSTA